ncbi:MAG: hypothetical protein D6717_06550 [Gammaproteobacteria bacterium]|nr:MAG: hypothetical protein D6717_06550 [Gammaproteobacteria bacterium]
MLPCLARSVLPNREQAEACSRYRPVAVLRFALALCLALGPAVSPAAGADPMSDAEALLALDPAALEAEVGNMEADPWSGFVAGGLRRIDIDQAGTGVVSRDAFMLLQPEYYRTLGDRQSVQAVAYLRSAGGDARYTIADLREAWWEGSPGRVTLRVGVDRVFWGVTESQNLVDIINQRDLAADIDGDEKLGQPMVKLSFDLAGGSLSAYWLPLFRERRFPARGDSLSTFPAIAESQAEYESGRGRHHQDFALRWSSTRGQWDIGLSLFRGTDRQPQLLLNPADGGQTLIPRYLLLDQAGLDLQWTHGSWLLKLEAVRRWQSSGDYWATVGGFEYLWPSVFGSNIDAHLIGEHLYDSRKERAVTPFQHDVMIGARLEFNDVQGTQLTAGLIEDQHQPARSWRLDLSRRLLQDWRIQLKWRRYERIPPQEQLFGVRGVNYLEASLRYYF